MKSKLRVAFTLIELLVVRYPQESLVAVTNAWKFADFAARSYHSGGVHALSVDGATRYVSDNVEV